MADPASSGLGAAVTAVSTAADAVSSTLASDLASTTSAVESAVGATASAAATMVSSVSASAVASMVTSSVSSWVTVTATFTDGALTTTVPYLDPYTTLAAPLPQHTADPVPIKVAGKTYDLWTLTTNPFLQKTSQCVIGDCSLLLGYSRYLPAAGPTIFLLALFAFAFLFHIPVGIFRKTWGYMIGLVFGCGLEVAGYVGRYRYRTNPFLQANFLLNIICLTIGPAFLTAAIYLCLARVIMAYGSGNARFPPRFYTTVFVAGDILALVLQAAGGGIASTADGGSSTQQAGINTMIAGLVIQVVSLLFFIILSLDFAVCVLRRRAERNPAFAPLTGSLKFKAFLLALAFAVVTIFIRCCYRVAELSQGFESDFAQNEVLFAVLESAMIGAAAVALTVFHPGFIFGRSWEDANFSLRGRKPAVSERASDSSGEKAKVGRIRTREV